MAVTALAPRATTEFARDVRDGLLRSGQKRLSSKYLYDDLGSALFEAICLLPEYGLTRAETRILQEHAGDIVSALPQDLVVVELGSGSGQKTRILLEAISKKNHQHASYCPHTVYHPIEISRAALQRCETELRNLPGIRCEGVQHEYLEGLRQIAARRAPGQHLFVLFLGSSIGNFSAEPGLEFLSQIRAILKSGDSFLLAADLVKAEAKLLAAYDDPTGVTAAFNLNLLARINRELQGNFDLAQFAHLAVYNHETHSIEMHLRARSDQLTYIRQLDASIALQGGETIWTETSHKYSLPELRHLATRAGFCFRGQWLDHAWGFAENLWSVA